MAISQNSDAFGNIVPNDERVHGIVAQHQTPNLLHPNLHSCQELVHSIRFKLHLRSQL